MSKRRTNSPEFKAKVAMEAISPWAEQVSQALFSLDTGITGLDMKEIKIDDLQLPPATTVYRLIEKQLQSL